MVSVWVNQFFFINTARAIANTVAVIVAHQRGEQLLAGTLVFSEIIGVVSFIPFIGIALSSKAIPKKFFLPLIFVYIWQMFGLFSQIL